FVREGMDSVELAAVGGAAVMRTAVHTRRIVDPLWGGKTTGTAGKVGFGLLAAGDEAPARQLIGEPPNPFLGDRRDFYIARSQLSLGRSNYLGAIVTDTQFGVGHNRVGGAAIPLRMAPHNRDATLCAAGTQDPDGLSSNPGLGRQASYSYDSKPV